jgi:hypothetical protein
MATNKVWAEMSNIRTEHPGYFGVCLGLSLCWYIGIGVGLLLLPHIYHITLGYKEVAQYMPLFFWGVLYLITGVGLLLSASVKRVPHIYVRMFAGLGFSITLFWLIAFIITFFAGHQAAYLFLPPFSAILLMEFQAVVEPSSNPANRSLEGRI